MTRSRPLRRLSSLVLALFVGGGLGLPVADAAVFHARPGSWHLGETQVGSTDMAAPHAAGCALLAGPVSAPLPTSFEAGRLLTLPRITDVPFAVISAPSQHQPDFIARPRAPPVAA